MKEKFDYYFTREQMKGTITHYEDESVFKNRLLELKIYDDNTVHFCAGEWRFGCTMHLEDLKKFISEYEKRKQNDYREGNNNA